MVEGPSNVITKAYEALSRGDVDAWLASTSPDVELHEVAELPDAQVYRGHGQIREWAKAMLELVDEWQWTPEEVLLSEGAVVVVRASVSGRSQAGLPLDLVVFHVFEMKEEKVSSMRGFFSRASALEAAGIRE